MGRNVGGVGKCVGVWGRCRKGSGEVWGVWESVFETSVGGVGKCVGGWGVGEVWRR